MALSIASEIIIAQNYQTMARARKKKSSPSAAAKVLGSLGGTSMWSGLSKAERSRIMRERATKQWVTKRANQATKEARREKRK